jgi:hypothetical protein
MPSSAETAEILSTLEQKRVELEREIGEAKARLPAHSVKPAQMMPLLALEDEYDVLLKRIQALKQRSKSSNKFHD